MSKHTPGPWTLDLGNIGVDMKNNVGVDAPDHGGIAQVVWVMDDDANEGKNTPTCEANARLIAAAPDLLEALKLCEGNISSLLASTHPRVYGEWLDFVRATIAKAEGGAA